MLITVKNTLSQAVKDKNRSLLLEILHLVTDGLLKVEDANEAVEIKPIVDRSTLERSVRELAKKYIISNGERGNYLFTKSILEPICGRYKTIKDLTDTELERINIKLSEVDND
ncbi:hypothetical protein lam_654 [Candidatus Liberibacter americanus str. Sao Paulo]|uniref:Uncharacterized protein n=1 Tax=Candidatus Liberibacter americanus str. Sao Paulo TaxID=1261131 RepID=U6B518_9HYPH|nr:hypothetical protein [Candidatus Liberibacter americanus]AHA28000.1 hypothetical protein lam_654 [Candidatus Liberibacter americanus str. Sao Paulo]